MGLERISVAVFEFKEKLLRIGMSQMSRLAAPMSIFLDGVEVAQVTSMEAYTAVLRLYGIVTQNKKPFDHMPRC